MHHYCGAQKKNIGNIVVIGAYVCELAMKQILSVVSFENGQINNNSDEPKGKWMMISTVRIRRRRWKFSNEMQTHKHTYIQRTER